MIFDNTDYYFVSDIKFSKTELDLYVPEDMVENYTDEEFDTAIRSYMFYHTSVDYKFTKLDIGNAITLNPVYLEQSFNADDGDSIHECTKSQTGILLTDITVKTRENFIVPFDYNCTKYVNNVTKHDEIVEQEIFEHLMWSLPVFVFRLSKKKFL